MTESKLMTQAELAQYLNTTVAVLNTWRSIGRLKIPYIKYGRNLRYRKSDIDKWLESQTVNKPQGE